MILHESISSFPERYAAPVAHVIAGIEGSNATQFLVDHDDRERVTGTVVLKMCIRDRSMSSEVENIELKGKENNTDKLNLSVFLF